MRSCTALLVAAIAVAPTTGLAGRVVHFTDGRSLPVAAIEPSGALVRLTLAEGGEISIPLERVDRWEVTPDPVSPPPAAPPAPVAASVPWREAAGLYADLIAGAADRHRLDPALLTALAAAESAFDPRAVSPKGACGLLQLMPATAERFGVEDVFDVAQNVDGGARYLSWLLDRFDGRADLALAGYNAGEGAVDRHRGIPPYQETRRYVDRVLRGADRLAALAP
jgi:hypothetical protein